MRDTIVDTKDKDLTEDQAIIKQAHERFRELDNLEMENRREARDDLLMLAGKNHWPPDVVRRRELEERPTLTVNKLPAFVDQVTNDGRLNKLSIKIRPNGGGSTDKLAETFNGIIRNIENSSDAELAYQTALEGAANNGFGYFRIDTDYADDSTFDQEIYIRAIKNPLSVYLAPNREYGFIIEKIKRKELKERYGIEASPFSAELSEHSRAWLEEDMILLAEYWVKEPKKKKLYLLSDGRTVEAEEWTKISDELEEESDRYLEMSQSVPISAPPAPITISGEREVDSHQVMQYLIGGDKIIDRTKWAGKRIPIIKVPGKEIVVDDRTYSRGVIRFAKDPQRMYNYFRTAATETVGLAPKAPYIMEERMIEGHEEEWASIGRTNLPYLLFKGVPGMNPPRREVVTQTAIGEITESNLSNDEMKATTGLYDASLGAQSNEVSGKAIMARQREGDVSNFCYHDNLRRAVKEAGDILVEIIPIIYDTQRQVMVMDEMERDKMITVNEVITDEDTGEEVIINDLSQGRYKVVVTAGPSFTTSRVEAAESMLDFVRTAPDTAAFVMDLIAENQDWPGAAKIAHRLRSFLPPGIDDDEGPPQPQPPSIDEVVKRLKANSIELGNMKKKLDIVEQRKTLEGGDRELVEAGAQGALNAVMGGNNEGR